MSVIKDGRNGSRWSTPCPPGYSNGINCDKCDNKTYSSDIYQKVCRDCTNLPNKANGYYIWEGDDNTTQTPHSSPDCAYECKSEFTSKSSNPQCLSTFDLFVETVGGVVIFCLIIGSIVLLIIVMIINQIVCSKRRSIDKMIT